MPRTRGKPAPGPLVLDTHVWIWTMEGTAGELSNATVRLIEQAAISGDVAVAAISVWELAMLEAKDRLSLSDPSTSGWPLHSPRRASDWSTWLRRLLSTARAFRAWPTPTRRIE